MAILDLTCNSLKYLLISAPLALAVGCGQISLSGSGSTNELAPPKDPRGLSDAAIVASGSLIGLNGKTCSGAVNVYFSSGASAYDVFLNGISAPTDVGTLNIVPTASGAQPAAQQLLSSSGSKNYYFTGVSAGATWSLVSVRNPSTNLDYCQATLTSAGH